MEIKEFQQLIKRLYYEKDLKRGKEKTLIWLFEEMGELAEAVRKEDVDSIREEMADVFAWLVSLANLYGIDLEEAVKSKYPNVCIKCGKIPCECDER